MYSLLYSRGLLLRAPFVFIRSICEVIYKIMPVKLFNIGASMVGARFKLPACVAIWQVQLHWPVRSSEVSVLLRVLAAQISRFLH